MITTREWIQRLQAAYPHASQVELAEMLGVAKSSVSHWLDPESYNGFSEEVAMKIADLLQVDPISVLTTSLFTRAKSPKLKDFYEAMQNQFF